MKYAIFHAPTGALQIYHDRDLADAVHMTPMAAAMLAKDLHDYIARALAKHEGEAK